MCSAYLCRYTHVPIYTNVTFRGMGVLDVEALGNGVLDLKGGGGTSQTS